MDLYGYYLNKQNVHCWWKLTVVKTVIRWQLLNKIDLNNDQRLFKKSWFRVTWQFLHSNILLLPGPSIDVSSLFDYLDVAEVTSPTNLSQSSYLEFTMRKLNSELSERQNEKQPACLEATEEGNLPLRKHYTENRLFTCAT